jgi:hypothetical protein
VERSEISHILDPEQIVPPEAVGGRHRGVA